MPRAKACLATIDLQWRSCRLPVTERRGRFPVAIPPAIQAHYSGRARMSLFDLSGRVAVVTGGNGGIGLGMAKGLAAAGATIVVAGRDAAKNAAAVKELQTAGGKASAIPVDVLQEESCRKLIDQTMKAHGRLDILVNNAGMSIRKQPE